MSSKDLEKLADQVAAGDFQGVPLDVLYIIIEDYLSPDEILKLCQTSTYFRDRVCKPSATTTDRIERLWKRLYERDFTEKPLPEGETYASMYQKALRQNNLAAKKSLLKYAENVASHGWEKLLDVILSRYDCFLLPSHLVSIMIASQEDPDIIRVLEKYGLEPGPGGCYALIGQQQAHCCRPAREGSHFCYIHSPQPWW